ncbi:MAG: hypothetical protein JO104_02485 [Candidatus Eremiobacteraeota bacterium]|nr:hypothetical protein [Candidatus Eremiobacteraeota bacterium]
MAVNVSEYMNKFQEEGLAAIKRTQDAGIDAMRSFREFNRELNENPGTVPAFENIPTPTQLVELSFGFASQLLELRKAFTLRIAEMLVETQKQTEMNFKAATTVPNKPQAPVK